MTVARVVWGAAGVLMPFIAYGTYILGLPLGADLFGDGCVTLCVGYQVLLFVLVPGALGSVMVTRRRLWGQVAVVGGAALVLLVAYLVYATRVAESKGQVWLAVPVMAGIGAVVVGAIVFATLRRRGPVTGIAAIAGMVAMATITVCSTFGLLATIGTSTGAAVAIGSMGGAIASIFAASGAGLGVLVWRLSELAKPGLHDDLGEVPAVAQ